MLNLIKIGADGAQLPADAPEWVAVLLPDHGLMFSARRVIAKAVDHAACTAACASLDLAGFTDWSLPTRPELLHLIDLERHGPATDPAFFPELDTDWWYWTSSAAAWSSASAWLVDFNDGYVYYNPRHGVGFALAVRRVGQSSAL